MADATIQAHSRSRRALPAERDCVGDPPDTAQTRTNSIEIVDAELATPCRQTTVVEIPPGFELYSLPEDEVFQYGELSVRYSYRISRDKLICERSYHLPVISVPVGALAEFNQVKERIFNKEREKIVFQRLDR